MKDLLQAEFKRKFSTALYKNMKLKLNEMTFGKDFVCDKRGDLYPILASSDDCSEAIEYNRYVVRGGSVTRLIGQFFPYATYEVSAHLGGGSVGFCFALPDATATVSVFAGKLQYACGANTCERVLPDYISNSLTMIVSCRPTAFDIYFEYNGKPEFFESIKEPAVDNSHDYSCFTNSTVALSVSGKVIVESVLGYIDNGTSIADIRPIRYENGEVMVEYGKIYLTASIRMQETMFQGIFSWIPSTAELALCGALFYDAGDGKWCGDVAASVLYHRDEKLWYLWVCSFSHDHILGHATFEGDLRFGVNVVDIELMPKADEGAHITDFAGFSGDEDPDFFYDKNSGKWKMAICRLDPSTRQYRYVFFESEHPFGDYYFIGKGLDGAETGGSFVKVGGELFFLCGNDFNKRADYRIYHKDGMTNARFDYDDGGFRGWGTLIPIKMGSRTRYFWLTFDRHRGSDYNWSYGNLYCFEAP